MYKLVNVEDRNRENPETFHIEPRSRRESLFVGDVAKCIFEGTRGEGGDRMWLRILGPISPGQYYGELLNSPAQITGIEEGEKIEFGPEHISDLEKQPRKGLFDPGLRSMTHECPCGKKYQCSVKPCKGHVFWPCFICNPIHSHEDAQKD